MRILLTGARGFIGRECLAKLRALGEVHALSSSEVDLLEGAPRELLKKLKPTHLVHLAWIAEPGVFWESPLNARWQAASAALFEAFYAAGGSRVVAAGSCAEYAPSTTPHAEDATPIAPDTTYGRAKAATCVALRAAAAGERGWAWMRLFFPYGPGEHPARFIPSAINAVLRGETLECTSGTQVRDFIHVRDVASATVLACENHVSGTRAFNVGFGTPRTVGDMAEALSKALRGPAPIVTGQYRMGDVRHITADSSRLRNELGWEPKIDFLDGMAELARSAE